MRLENTVESPIPMAVDILMAPRLVNPLPEKAAIRNGIALSGEKEHIAAPVPTVG